MSDSVFQGFGLTAMSANMFVIMPTNILTYINQDIGMSSLQIPR